MMKEAKDQVEDALEDLAEKIDEGMFWLWNQHKKGTLLGRLLLYFNAICIFAVVLLGVYHPQRRSVVFAVIFLWYIILSDVFEPLIRTTWDYVIISGSMHSDRFDGYLSWFPRTIDFKHVDINKPKELLQRMKSMENDSQVLRMLYEMPNEGEVSRNLRPGEIVGVDVKGEGWLDDEVKRIHQRNRQMKELEMFERNDSGFLNDLKDQ